MTNTEETSNRYFRLLAESDARSEDISLQIVLLMRRLYRAYPEPLSDPLQDTSESSVDLAGRILNWLKSEHFVKVEGNQVWLTLTGHETVRKTGSHTGAYQAFFDDPTDGPAPPDSTGLVLELLRTHFVGGRASGH